MTALLQIRNLDVTFDTARGQIPAVRDVYFVSGSYDFLLHVATADVADLRSIITERLSGTHLVAGTDTHLIFEHRRGN